jgi:hypothetical protein
MIIFLPAYIFMAMIIVAIILAVHAIVTGDDSLLRKFLLISEERL